MMNREHKSDIFSLPTIRLSIQWVFAITLLLTLLAAVQTPAYAVEDKVGSHDLLLQELNQLRTEKHLKILKENKLLDDAAQKKVLDMYEKNYWSHISPIGKSPWEFIKESGYVYKEAGENLAYGFTNDTDIINAWHHSPSHEKIMVNPNYEEVGFATKAGNFQGLNTTVIVAMFATK